MSQRLQKWRYGERGNVGGSHVGAPRWYSKMHPFRPPARPDVVCSTVLVCSYLCVLYVQSCVALQLHRVPVRMLPHISDDSFSRAVLPLTRSDTHASL